MLTNLQVKNIVLIESLEVDFRSGYTALTGETGAGKSIILSALGLLLGKKADGSILRFGSESGEVSGEFDLPDSIKPILAENEIEANGLLIRRKITADGKSKAYINDSAVSLKLLSEIGQYLVEIHSQHEQSTLLDPYLQREIVDKYAGIDADVAALGRLYAQWRQAASQLAAAIAKIEAAKREEDYLRHVVAELDEFGAVIGEEEELAAKRRAMMEFEKTAGIIRSSIEELTEGRSAENSINSSQKILIRAGSERFKEAIDILERAAIEVNEAMKELERLAAEGEYSQDELERIEARLFAIRDLCRKYECRPDELPAHREQAAEKLKVINDAEVNIKALEELNMKLAAEYAKQAETVTAARKKASQKLEKQLLAELKPLAMQGTRFEVRFAVTEPTAKGVDKVEFYASTNPGVPLAGLAGVASGGEISRFMLALKVVLIGASSAPTVIFDEIDTGTGGAIAASIGERLAKLGKQMQVFVVTHLPQVAASATHHLKVSKKSVKGSNITSLEELSASERKEELARMLAGAEISDEARAAAGKLLS